MSDGRTFETIEIRLADGSTSGSKGFTKIKPDTFTTVLVMRNGVRVLEIREGHGINEKVLFHGAEGGWLAYWFGLRKEIEIPKGEI